MSAENITANEIREIKFTEEVRGGYSKDQVDEILTKAAATIDALTRENNSASELLDIATSEHDAEIDGYKEQIAKLQAENDELKATNGDQPDGADVISQVMIAAQRTGNEIVRQSRSDAQKLRDDATESAKNIIDSANAERDTINSHIVNIVKQRESERVKFVERIESLINDLAAVRDTYSVSEAPSADVVEIIDDNYASQYNWDVDTVKSQVDAYGKGDLNVQVSEDIAGYVIDGVDDVEPTQQDDTLGATSAPVESALQ